MSKSDQLAIALGTIDELNSWLGICRSVSPELKRMQTNLLTIGSILAGSKLKLTNYEVIRLEKLIDKLTLKLPKLSNFIYPVGQLQVVRAVCRRAEREIVTYVNSKPEILRSKEIKSSIKYLNRLSDALFVLARYVNLQNNIPEEVWKS
jgi:cob(I)alamin adenosyltransferase